MLNQETVYQHILNERWQDLIDILYAERKEINTDVLLTQAAKTFEEQFFKKVWGYSRDSVEIIEILEKIYILHHGKFYTLSSTNYKSLILELVKRKPLKEAYNYAKEYPYDEVCKETVRKFEEQVAKEQSTQLEENKGSINWVEVYNRIFELINDQNDAATYFSGSRFINTVKEFQPYFPSYNQYVDIRNNEGKSTSRKIYYYDILFSLSEDIRNRVIDRVLEITKPFKPEKTQAIEELLGKRPQVITLNFEDTLSNITDTVIGAPVVFISYSWDNEEHKTWVLSLADQLVIDGVDVILDRYYLKPGKNLPHFVENSISRANRIIVIFTPNYKLKADKREGGVGYEYSIMNVDLYNHQTTNEKIIPVLRSGGVGESIPTFMQQFIHLDVRNDEKYENSYLDLLREIYNEPAIQKPKLGNKPSFPVTNTNEVKKPTIGVNPFAKTDGNALATEDKLSSLKRKLGQNEKDVALIIRNEDAITNAIEQSIKPLIKKWELKLKEFDVLFFSRNTLVTANEKTKTGDNIFTTLEAVVGGELPRLKNLNQPLIKELRIHCSFQRLRVHRTEVNYNGGDIYVIFHRNAYEVTFTGSKTSITHLYGEWLSDEEMGYIIITISNWLTTNIEKAIETGESK